MWKLLWVVILVAVLSIYHTDASRKIDKDAIKNKKRQTQFLEAPFFASLKLKRDDQNSIVIDSPKGYYYTTPKPDGYVYTKGGYVYVTPTSTPGITYLPPTKITPRTPTTTRTTTRTTPRTTTTIRTTITTTPSTTTTTTTSSTTTSTFKPTYLPPHKYTPSEPPRTTIRVTPKTFPYPKFIYTTFRIETTPYERHYTDKPILPTTPRPYDFISPKKNLPPFPTLMRADNANNFTSLLSISKMHKS